MPKLSVLLTSAAGPRRGKKTSAARDAEPFEPGHLCHALPALLLPDSSGYASPCLSHVSCKGVIIASAVTFFDIQKRRTLALIRGLFRRPFFFPSPPPLFGIGFIVWPGISGTRRHMWEISARIKKRISKLWMEGGGGEE